MFKKTLIVSVTLAVTSCVSSPILNNVDSSLTNSQTTQLNQADMFLASKYKQNESNRNLQPSFDSSVASYRSLKIDNSSFKTKASFTGDAAVSFSVGTKRYALTKGFMDKLRFVLDQYKPGTDVLKAILTTKAFDKLAAADGVQVAIVANATNGDQTAFTSNYTNSTDETAFVTLLKTYSSVSMPNYLDDTSGSFAIAFPTAQDIQIVVNTSGIRNAFLDAINTKLGSDGVLSATDINELNTMEVQSIGTAAQKLPNAGEKAFLTSIINNNPFAGNVVLLSGTDIVSRDIQLYYGESDTLSTSKDILIKSFGMLNRNGITLDSSSPPLATAYTPTPSGTNYSGAASLLAAKYYTGGTLPTTYAGLHSSMRNIHIAGQATSGLPTTPVLPTKSTFFRTLSATGLTYPTPSLVASPGATEFGEFVGAFTSSGVSELYKLPKAGTTPTTLKFKASIENFFSADIADKALIVPASRSATGAITFSTTSNATTHYVAIFSQPGSIAGNYTYTLYDPGYNNGSDSSYYDIGSSTVPSTVLTSLFNYGGTVLVGVKY